MIQLDVRTPRARKFVGGVGGLTPTTYIQLAGAGSIIVDSRWILTHIRNFMWVDTNLNVQNGLKIDYLIK